MTEGGGQGGGEINGRGGAGGEIEFEFAIGAAGDGERARAGVEGDEVAWLAEFAKEDVSGGEGGVAAEVDLDGGSEPAEMKAGLAGADEEGGFGEAVFEGEGLQEGVLGPGRQRDDGGGIAGEKAVGKGVDPVEGEGVHSRRAEAGARRTLFLEDGLPRPESASSRCSDFAPNDEVQRQKRKPQIAVLLVLFECCAGEAADLPLEHPPGADTLVEVDGGFIPIEDGPLHAAAAAGVGEFGEVEEERLAVAMAAEFGFHKEVLQVETGAGEEGGVVEEIESEAGRHVIDEAENAVGDRWLGEKRAAELVFGGGDVVGELFIGGEIADEAEDEGGIGGRGGANDQGHGRGTQGVEERSVKRSKDA